VLLSSLDSYPARAPGLTDLAQRARHAEARAVSDPRRFPTTRHSVVLDVKSADSVQRARAFEVIAATYWKPVYKYTRVRWKKSGDESAELTQAFFATAFEKGYFTGYDPSKARFRTYVKMCLDRFISNAVRAGQRLKRGGNAVVVSIDAGQAEHELAAHQWPSGDAMEEYFDAEWVRALLSLSVDELRSLCEDRGKEAHFQLFERCVLADEQDRPAYAEIAQELGLSLSDVKNYLTFTRREFRRIIIDKIREITATEEEFRSEVRAVLGTSP